MDQICKNVRSIRKEKKISLKTLSEMSGLSLSYLSNYENGKVNITIASLYQIAQSLGVSIKELVAEKEDETLFVVPKDKRYAMVGLETPTGNFIQELITRGPSFDMQIIMMHLPPHATSGAPKTHECEEFVYILKGSILLHFGENQKVKLNEGDTAYYNAMYPHYWENPTDEPADFLAVANKGGF